MLEDLEAFHLDPGVRYVLVEVGVVHRAGAAVQILAVDLPQKIDNLAGTGLELAAIAHFDQNL